MPDRDRNFNNLGTWLPKQLNRLMITPEELAQRANVTRGAVYNWMCDRNRPTEETMGVVCRVLGVPLEEGLAQYVPKKRGRPRGAK